MSNNEKENTKRATGGYKPLSEGYQPQVNKKGYQPKGREEASPPKSPKGGTGEGGGKKE